MVLNGQLYQFFSLALGYPLPSACEKKWLLHDITLQQVLAKQTDVKCMWLDQPVDYCRSHGCQGYHVIELDLFPLVNYARKVYKQLDGVIKCGNKKRMFTNIIRGCPIFHNVLRNQCSARIHAALSQQQNSIGRNSTWISQMIR